MAYLVLRIKGLVNIPYWALTTLTNLNLSKKFNATILPENQQTLGMLHKVKDSVSWYKADKEIIKDLLEKKGKKASKKSITQSDIQERFGTFEAIAESLSSDEMTLSEMDFIKPWFTLNPPKGGFKRQTKKQYSQGGILGENKELIEIVRRMM